MKQIKKQINKQTQTERMEETNKGGTLLISAICYVACFFLWPEAMAVAIALA